MDVDTNSSLIYGSGNVGRPQFAPFNRTGTNRVRTNDGKTDYHSMQVKLDRRFRNGLLLNNSYTLGRARDYVNENTTISTPLDFEQSYARSNFDRKHSYVLNAIYELPWGPGKKWMSEGTMGQDRRRLAGQRPVHRAVRQPAQHHRQQHDVEHAGHHLLSQSHRRQQRPRGPRSGQALLRSVGLQPAGGRRAGQHGPQRRS